MTKRNPLVCQHLENVSRTMLEEHRDVVAKFARRRRGVYALYRRDKLHYVGLASNLPARLKNHLKNGHAKSWDRFSMYLTIGDSHLRELEALVLRIVQPQGNKQKGRLSKSQSLLKGMKQMVRDKDRQAMDHLFGRLRPGAQTDERKRGKRKSRRRVPSLEQYVTLPTKLRADHKGRKFKATARRDGTVRFDGKVYDSPSSAAKAAIKRPCNGWWLWRCERAPGDWVRLKDLR